MNRQPPIWSKALEKMFKGLYYSKTRAKTDFNKEEIKYDKRPGAPPGLPERYPGKWPSESPDRDAAKLINILMPTVHGKYHQEFCIGVDLNRNFPYQWAVSYYGFNYIYIA